MIRASQWKWLDFRRRNRSKRLFSPITTWFNTYRFSALLEVALAIREIESAGPDREISRTCPNVEDLDLSSNLLKSWNDIATICVQLPRLNVLRLKYAKNHSIRMFMVYVVKIALWPWMRHSWDLKHFRISQFYLSMACSCHGPRYSSIAIVYTRSSSRCYIWSPRCPTWQNFTLDSIIYAN